MNDANTRLINSISLQLNLQYIYSEQQLISLLQAITYKLNVGTVYEFCYKTIQKNALQLKLLTYNKAKAQENYSQFYIDVFNIVCGQNNKKENINIYKSILKTLNFIFIEFQKEIFVQLQSLTNDILIQLPDQILELDIVQLINLHIILNHFIMYKQNHICNLEKQWSNPNIQQLKYQQFVIENQDSFSESHLLNDFNDTSFSIHENDSSQLCYSNPNISKYKRRGSGLSRGSKSSRKEYNNYNDILSIISHNYANCSTTTQFTELLEPLLSLYDKLKYKKISINQFKNIDCRATIKLEQMLASIFVGVTVNIFDEGNNFLDIKIPTLDCNLFDQESISSHNSKKASTQQNEFSVKLQDKIDVQMDKKQINAPQLESSTKRQSPLRIQAEICDHQIDSDDDNFALLNMKDLEVNFQLSEKQHLTYDINRQVSYVIDSRLSVYDNDVYFNEIKELLKIIDLVEYYIKDPKDDQYAGMYFINYIHCAFTNIDSIQSLIKTFLKRSIKVTKEEAQLLGNCLILNKLDVNKFIWVDYMKQHQQENQQLSRNVKYQLDIENAIKDSISTASEDEKYLEQLQNNFQLAVQFYIQNSKKK